MLYKEVAKSEILDWWDETRDLISQRCEAAQIKLISLADERTADLGTVDLLNPWSDTCQNIQSKIEEEIKRCSASLSRELELSLRESIETVENNSSYREVDLTSAGLIAASGATAAGAVGLAIAATGLSTTTLPAWVFLSTTAFSWPVFAGIATGAVALGAVSATARNMGYDWALNRYRTMLHETIRQALTDNDQTGKQSSLRVELLREIDAVRDARLEGINS